MPQLQIQSTPARIGIDSKLGHYEIKQSPATVRMDSRPAVVHIQSEPAIVHIDQSKTWEALTGGKPIPFWNRIYNSSGRYVLDAINQTVQDYNRIGNILANGNPIAEIARESLSKSPSKLPVYGPASPNNVEFTPVLNKPQIDVQVGDTDIQVQVNRPNIDYKRGHVRTYMEQYPSVQVKAPKMDLML